MPPQLKTFKIPFVKALQAVGNDESLIETLYSLQEQRVIWDFEIEVQIRVEPHKAVSLEHFFLLQQLLPSGPSKKKKVD